MADGLDYEQWVSKARSAHAKYSKTRLDFANVILEWHRSGEFGLNSENVPRKSITEAVKDEFGWESSRCYQMLDFARGIENIKAISSDDELSTFVESMPEGQMRVIKDLTHDEPAKAVELIEKVREETGDKLTAKKLRDAVKELEPEMENESKAQPLDVDEEDYGDNEVTECQQRLVNTIDAARRECCELQMLDPSLLHNEIMADLQRARERAENWNVE